MRCSHCWYSADRDYIAVLFIDGVSDLDRMVIWLTSVVIEIKLLNFGKIPVKKHSYNPVLVFNYNERNLVMMCSSRKPILSRQRNPSFIVKVGVALCLQKSFLVL